MNKIQHRFKRAFSLDAVKNLLKRLVQGFVRPPQPEISWEKVKPSVDEPTPMQQAYLETKRKLQELHESGEDI
jgi:hypothetical protein